MKVLFSSADLELKHKRGIGFYSKSLLKSLYDNGCENHLLTSCESSRETDIISKISFGKNNKYTTKNKLLFLVRKTLIANRFFKKVVLNKQKKTEEAPFLKYVKGFVNATLVFDIEYFWNKFIKARFRIPTKGFDVMITSIPSNLRVDKGTKLIQTLHDVIPLEESPLSGYGKVIRQMVKGMTENSDIILSVSEYSKNRLLSFFPETKADIIVTHQPIPVYPEEEQYVQDESNVIRDLNKFELQKGKYFLYVGAIEERKNILTLIEAYNEVKSQLDIPLVIAGGVSEVDIELHNKIEEIKRGDISGVKYLGYVSNTEKLSLLKGSLSFVFVSFSEGFGLPPLEAMKMGTPVICSNKTSLPEVCGDAALLVEPTDVGEIGRKMLELYQNPILRQDLIQRGYENVKRFSFESYNKKISDVLREVMR